MRSLFNEPWLRTRCCPLYSIFSTLSIWPLLFAFILLTWWVLFFCSGNQETQAHDEVVSCCGRVAAMCGNVAAVAMRVPFKIASLFVAVGRRVVSIDNFLRQADIRDQVWSDIYCLALPYIRVSLTRLLRQPLMVPLASRRMRS